MSWILFSIPFVIAGLLIAIGPVVFGLFQQQSDERAEALGLTELAVTDRPEHKAAA